MRDKILKAMKSLTHGAPCCSVALEMHLGFDPRNVLDMLIAAKRVTPVRGFCGHCNGRLYQVLS